MTRFLLRSIVVWAALGAPLAGAFTASDGGNEMGNGGHAVECSRDDGSVSWEVLDVYEIRMDRRRWTFLLPNVPGNYIQKAEWAFDRLDRLAPGRARSYKAALRHYVRTAKFLPPWPEVEAERRGPPRYPVASNCKIHLLAAQRLLDGRYFELHINSSVWEKLDEDNKAAIFIHEVVYWDGLRHGQWLSHSARYLSGLLMADVLDSYDRKAFFRLLESLTLAPYTWQDPPTGIVFGMTRNSFNDVEDAIAHCRKMGMRPAYDEEAMSDAFLRFASSYVGRGIGGLNAAVRFFVDTAEERPALVSFEAGKRELVEEVSGPFRALCARSPW